MSDDIVAELDRWLEDEAHPLRWPLTTLMETARLMQRARDEIVALRKKDTEEWQAGVEAMRELAGYVAIHACLVPPDGGAPTEEEREMCAEVARQIYKAGLPLRKENAAIRNQGDET